MLCGLLLPSAGRHRSARLQDSRRGRGAQAPHRLHDAEVLAVRRPDRHRESRLRRRRARASPRAARARASTNCCSATGSPICATGSPARCLADRSSASALAAAVLHEPELLLLDEPTSAVDPQSRRDFWDSLFASRGRGHDDSRVDALHGRGRALPSSGDPRPWPAGRRRQPAANSGKLPGAALLIECERAAPTRRPR